MKKVIFSAALMMGLSAAVFAGAPKGDAKDASSAKSETEAGAVVKWFHFTGDATDDDQLSDPSMYQAEDAPTCPDNNPQDYRCDIKILSNSTGNQPDLSQSIQQTRTRVTP
ncbi:hypothetical protein [Taibaiella koreensis]|uniref:hypothetical protein n=1 Tax=Taibaiella koreensis TaxID=1268548 RepID=UPI000E59CDBB|nr:hypothetical protein [Taibaiella koreensis]